MTGARWPNPLPCGQWMAGLVARVADDAPGDTEHQATCAHCQHALVVLNELWEAVGALAREEIQTPAGIDRAALRRIRRERFVVEAAQLFGGVLPRLTRALLVYGGLIGGQSPR